MQWMLFSQNEVTDLQPKWSEGYLAIMKWKVFSHSEVKDIHPATRLNYDFLKRVGSPSPLSTPCYGPAYLFYVTFINHISQPIPTPYISHESSMISRISFRCNLHFQYFLKSLKCLSDTRIRIFDGLIWCRFPSDIPLYVNFKVLLRRPLMSSGKLLQPMGCSTCSRYYKTEMSEFYYHAIV